jgi:exodeoxyribonuclease-3
MRIATWNINGLRARLDFVRLWLRERKPDIVGLQELKLPDDKFPHDVFEEEGYRALTYGQKSWNGVAIVIRDGMQAEVTQRGLAGQDDFGSRLITAKLEGLSFTTVYCPNGKNLEHEDYARKLVWFDALADHWKTIHPADEPAILCGDFNVVPTSLDSWNEEKLAGDLLHTADERARLRNLIDLGLVDLFRARHPDEQAFSWWDYRGGAFHRKQGLRIDFLLATKPTLERTREVMIDRDFRKKQEGLTASDHAPVIADLD